MAKVEHYFTKFEEHCFYHVYNRTVDRQPMFKNADNYRFFLKQYDNYLSPVVDTYAFCLLGNHFHILIKVKQLEADENAENKKTAHDIVSHQFRKFYQSYSMAFNKQHSRVGTLFQTPFKRALIDSDIYFTRLVTYIHTNPQLHGLTNDFRNWEWSSYNRLIAEHPSKLMREDVINWFGNKINYSNAHSNIIHPNDLNEIMLEDE